MSARALCVGLATVALAPSCGQAADMSQRYVVPARPSAAELQPIPQCDDYKVLKKVANAFHDKETEYWKSNLSLISFTDPRELAYRPWGSEFIVRRFCTARTFVSDGVDRPVFYSIAEDLGTLGITYGVEFCVTGLDRNWAFSPACKMAQP